MAVSHLHGVSPPPLRLSWRGRQLHVLPHARQLGGRQLRGERWEGRQEGLATSCCGSHHFSKQIKQCSGEHASACATVAASAAPSRPLTLRRLTTPRARASCQELAGRQPRWYLQAQQAEQKSTHSHETRQQGSWEAASTARRTASVDWLSGAAPPTSGRPPGRRVAAPAAAARCEPPSRQSQCCRRRSGRWLASPRRGIR